MTREIAYVRSWLCAPRTNTVQRCVCSGFIKRLRPTLKAMLPMTKGTLAAAAEASSEVMPFFPVPAITKVDLTSYLLGLGWASASS